MNYKKLVEKYNDEMIETLKEFCSIPSEYSSQTKTKEMPFGKSVDDALKFVGKLGEKEGFAVDYCDGYATELTIGEGDKMIGIFAHADVVPATGDWENPPYEPVIKDGKFFARGSSDDKGPFVATFYAAKALKEAGLLKGYRLRFVVGGDEERGSGCLHHYFEELHKENPTYGFTPDSDFPVICGEKNITDFFPELEVAIPNVKSISGGKMTNAVCDKVIVKLEDASKFAQYLEENKINFLVNGNEITFIGQSCHGSTPAEGINAALIALKCLGDFYHVESISKIGNDLLDTTGAKFGCFTKGKILGESTYCVGKINYENNKLVFSVNFRYGESTNLDEIIQTFNQHFGTKCEKGGVSKMLLFEPKCKLIKALLKAYRKETGDRSPALTTGGGTYAKHAENTVAFGALFPGRVSTMHEPNEYMPIDDIKLSAVIYARAIDYLGKL